MTKCGMKTKVAYKMLKQLGIEPDEAGVIAVDKNELPGVFNMLEDLEFTTDNDTIIIEPATAVFQNRDEKLAYVSKLSDKLATHKKKAEEEPLPSGPRRSQAEQQEYLERLLVRKERVPKKRKSMDEPEKQTKPGTYTKSSTATPSTSSGSRLPSKESAASYVPPISRAASKELLEKSRWNAAVERALGYGPGHRMRTGVDSSTSGSPLLDKIMASVVVRAQGSGSSGDGVASMPTGNPPSQKWPNDRRMENATSGNNGGVGRPALQDGPSAGYHGRSDSPHSIGSSYSHPEWDEDQIPKLDKEMAAATDLAFPSSDVFSRLYKEPKSRYEQEAELLKVKIPAPENTGSWPGWNVQKATLEDQKCSIDRLSVPKERLPPDDPCANYEQTKIPPRRRTAAEQQEYMRKLALQDAKQQGDEQQLALCPLGSLLPPDGRLSRISESSAPRKGKAIIPGVAPDGLGAGPNAGPLGAPGNPYREKLTARLPRTPTGSGTARDREKDKRTGKEGGAKTDAANNDGDTELLRDMDLMSYGHLLVDEHDTELPPEADDLDIEAIKNLNEEELLTRIDEMIQQDELIPDGIREGLEEVLWSALLVKRSTQVDIPFHTLLNMPLGGFGCHMPPSLIVRLEEEMPDVHRALQGAMDETNLPSADQVSQARNSILKFAFEKPKGKTSNTTGTGAASSAASAVAAAITGPAASTSHGTLHGHNPTTTNGSTSSRSRTNSLGATGESLASSKTRARSSSKEPVRRSSMSFWTECDNIEVK